MPTERVQIIAALNVPFAKISVMIASFTQSLRPVSSVCAQYTLVVVNDMYHFEHPMVVR
jgi:hypothetical protein